MTGRSGYPTSGAVRHLARSPRNKFESNHIPLWARAGGCVDHWNSGMPSIRRRVHQRPGHVDQVGHVERQMLVLSTDDQPQTGTDQALLGTRYSYCKEIRRTRMLSMSTLRNVSKSDPPRVPIQICFEPSANSIPIKPQLTECHLLSSASGSVQLLNRAWKVVAPTIGRRK